MNAHGIATLALCEALAMTKDGKLRSTAQHAVDFIVSAQDKTGGGWRYKPKERGDTTVTGWQIMALKSAQMSGLVVPDITMLKAQRFLDSMCDTTNEGYGYASVGSTATMSAVGLLCRQYLQASPPKWCMTWVA